MPLWTLVLGHPVGLRGARHRRSGACRRDVGGGGASFTRDIHVEYVHPTAHREQAAITLQLLGGVWILQTFPAVAV